ncbi:MAG: glycosyltransferase family 61 protein [Alphaproteobacteria bacterium]|nr:glycosyltransferase family 61 protein [Alphaproteobacteria bacterium]
METLLYTTNKFRSFFDNITKNLFLKDDLNLKHYRNATIVIDKKSERIGLFDSDGNGIPDASLTRHNNKKHPLPKYKLSSSDDFIDEDVICCFNLNQHFGHFLIEGLTLLWPLVSEPYKSYKIVFASTFHKKLPDYIINFLEILGIKSEQILYTTKTTRFRNVLVPEQAGVISSYSSRHMAKLYKTIADNVSDTRNKSDMQKIYVSRAKFGQHKDFGELKIQNIFEKNGYTVIYPETLSLTQQISLLSKCSHLAGLCGTALHLSVFMPQGGTVIAMRRTTALDSPDAVQYLLNKITGLNSVFIDTSIETHESPHWSLDFPQIVGVTKYLRQFFDDNKFEYTDADLKTNQADMENYEIVYAKWQKKQKKIKKLKPIIRLLTIVLPRRSWRRKCRNWFENVLHVK